MKLPLSTVRPVGRMTCFPPIEVTIVVNMEVSGEAAERLREEGFRGALRKRHTQQLDKAYDSQEYYKCCSISKICGVLCLIN